MHDKIKLGIVSLYYPPVGGGGEVYLDRLIHSLENIEKYLWTTSSDENHLKTSLDGVCTVECFGEPPEVDYSTMGDWFEEKHEALFESILAWSKRIQLDLIILNSPIIYFYQTKKLIRSLKGGPQIGCIPHDVPGKSFSLLLDDYQETESWEESLDNVRPRLLDISKDENTELPGSPFSFGNDFTIYNSEWIKEFYDPHSEKDSFIFHPIISRTNELPELGLEPVDLTIVNPLPMKGGALFIALANYHFRGHKIRILEGNYNSSMTTLEPYLTPVRSALYQAELPDNIEVLGHVQNMSEVYRNTKVLLQPTRIESFGMTAVEAVFENCIVATTDIPGIIEGVGDAALQFPYYATPQQWADKISSVLKIENHASDKMLKRKQFIQNRQREEIERLQQFLESMVLNSMAIER